jgi:hypothetical protein
MRIRWAHLLLSFLLVTSGVWNVSMAQEDPESMFAKPTPEHEILKRDVGVWDATVTFHMGPPGTPATVSKAVETNRLLDGGLWLLSEYQGEFAGRAFLGRSTVGYDPALKRYVGAWVDNASARLMTMRGTYDEASGTLTMMTEGVDPATGKLVPQKHETIYKDEETRIHRMSQPGEGNKDVVMMEIVYKRRKY